MDNVLKRRLIGASILIALAVIFLPMLLVGPEPDLDDRRLREPLPEMPDGNREIRRIPLDPELARVPPARVEPTVQPPAIDPSSADPTDSDRPIRREPLRDPVRSDQPEEIVLNPTAAEPDPSERVPDAAETPPAETDVVASAPVETVPEPVATPSEPVVQAAASGTWMVQVASFGSQESSRATRERLEALGHPVLSDEVVRGDTMLYRLRTGPYANRAQAETARGQIAATVAGVEPIVREMDAAELDAAPGFAVQVGSFASEDNAERETTRLRNLGFDAFRRREDASGRAIWKVLVGTVESRADAESLQARLAERAGVDGLVVSHP